MSRRTYIISVLFALALFTNNAYAQQVQGGKFHVLEATPKTVAWGYYAAATPPVLRINSGDRVEVHTLITSTPQRLEAAGVKPRAIAL